MAPMFEILLFAVLSGYFFYRLWSILGTRIDDDGPSVIEGESREIKDFDIHNMNENPKQQTISPEIMEKCQEITTVLPDFNIEQFIDGASMAFQMVLEAFRDNKGDILKNLLEQNVYKEFMDAIKDRKDRGQTIDLDVGQIKRTFIDNIDVLKDSILITVTFISEQMFATHNKEGLIVDNPSKLYIEMTDTWTFKKIIPSKDSLWKVSETRTS